MGSINNITNYFRRFFLPSKQNATTQAGSPKLYPFSIGNGIQIFPSVDNHKGIEIGYNGNATVFSIVSKSAKKFANIPRYVCDDPSTTVDPKDASASKKSNYLRNKINNKAANAPYSTAPTELNSPAIEALTNLINRPNNYQGRAAWYSELYSWYMMTGEVFIWVNRGYSVDKDLQAYLDDSGNAALDAALNKMWALQLYIMPTNFMTLLPDPDDAWDVFGYVLTYGGYQVFLRKEDVIHIKNTSLSFDPVTRTHLRGVSPLKAGGAVLQQNIAAVVAAVREYQNGGARGLLCVETDDPTSIGPGTADAIRSVIDKKINTNDVAGSVAFVAGQYTYLDMAKSTNLPMLDGQKYSDEQLCKLFGMPPQVFASDSTFSNVEMAKKSWLIDTLIPDAEVFDDEMNRVLLPAFGLKGKVCIKSDFINLPELQENQLQQQQALTLMPITYNEWRIASGYDPMDDPQCDVIMVKQGVVPLDQLNSEMDSLNQPLTEDYANSDKPGNDKPGK